MAAKERKREGSFVQEERGCFDDLNSGTRDRREAGRMNAGISSSKKERGRARAVNGDTRSESSE